MAGLAVDSDSRPRLRADRRPRLHARRPQGPSGCDIQAADDGDPAARAAALRRLASKRVAGDRPGQPIVGHRGRGRRVCGTTPSEDAASSSTGSWSADPGDRASGPAGPRGPAGGKPVLFAAGGAEDESRRFSDARPGASGILDAVEADRLVDVLFDAASPAPSYSTAGAGACRRRGAGPSRLDRITGERWGRASILSIRPDAGTRRASVPRRTTLRLRPRDLTPAAGTVLMKDHPLHRSSLSIPPPDAQECAAMSLIDRRRFLQSSATLTAEPLGL